MQRLIKFRVWCNNSFSYNALIGNGIVSFNNGMQWWDIDDSVVIQQFTGLTDRNGKEIYEGDILIQDAPHDCEWLGVVGFNNDGAKFQVDIFNHMKNIADNLQVTKYWGIIGNIFENPELLK